VLVFEFIDKKLSMCSWIVLYCVQLSNDYWAPYSNQPRRSYSAKVKCIQMIDVICNKGNVF